jgi:hypothetical protein
MVFQLTGVQASPALQAKLALLPNIFVIKSAKVYLKPTNTIPASASMVFVHIQYQ